MVGSPATITVTIDRQRPAGGAGGPLPAGAGRRAARELVETRRAGDGYQVRWKETSATDQTATTQGDPSTGWVTADVTATSRQITSLTNGTGYDVQVRATDGQTETGNGWGPWSDAQSEMPMQSADADLSALTGSTSTDGSAFDGTLTLDQTFDAATTSYTATVANNVTHAKLTPTVSDSNASVEVGKGSTLETVASGTASNAIAPGRGRQRRHRAGDRPGRHRPGLHRHHHAAAVLRRHAEQPDGDSLHRQLHLQRDAGPGPDLRRRHHGLHGHGGQHRHPRHADPHGEPQRGHDPGGQGRDAVDR